MLLIDKLHNATIVESERSRIDVLSVGIVPYYPTLPESTKISIFEKSRQLILV